MCIKIDVEKKTAWAEKNPVQDAFLKVFEPVYKSAHCLLLSIKHGK